MQEALVTDVVYYYVKFPITIDKIDYPEYMAQGYFVGSGAMESANKVLVQRRLKQAGMKGV